MISAFATYGSVNRIHPSKANISGGDKLGHLMNLGGKCDIEDQYCHLDNLCLELEEGRVYVANRRLKNDEGQ